MSELKDTIIKTHKNDIGMIYNIYNNLVADKNIEVESGKKIIYEVQGRQGQAESLVAAFDKILCEAEERTETKSKFIDSRDNTISSEEYLENSEAANFTEIEKEEKKSRFLMEKAVKFLGKKQDYACCGEFVEENGKKGNYVAIYDGHGEDKCIDLIRTFNQSEIMSNENPIECVIEKISEFRKKNKINMKNSGSTFVYAKIVTEDPEETGFGSIHIGNLSDSELVVYINGKRIYNTIPQISSTPGQMERLKREGRVIMDCPISQEKKPLIHEDEKITLEKATRINYIGMEGIVAAESLGHNEITGHSAQFENLKFDLKKDHVKIVCASDGLWDMLNPRLEEYDNILLSMNAEEMANFAELRWKQPWKLCADKNDMNKFTIVKFPKNGYDDVGIAIYEYFGSELDM